MQALRYAVVAYIKDPVGEFVRQMREEFRPEVHHSAAHVSVLPPRYLEVGETAILETFEELCSSESQFTVALGELDTFAPATPTIFLRVTDGAGRLCQMHSRFGASSLGGAEDWPYIPHMTILKTPSLAEMPLAMVAAEAHWASYKGDRTAWVRELTFVRENADLQWVDLATFPLHSPLL